MRKLFVLLLVGGFISQSASAKGFLGLFSSKNKISKSYVEVTLGHNGKYIKSKKILFKKKSCKDWSTAYNGGSGRSRTRG